MILQFINAQHGDKKETVATLNPRNIEPIITIDHTTISEKSGGGDHLNVVRIDIKGDDGQTVGKFWVDAFLNKQGRPTLHIATNVGDETHTKKLTGSWRDGHAHSLKLS